VKARRPTKQYVLEMLGRITIGGADCRCTIYDKTKTGARLINFDDVELPPQFVIQVDGSAALTCWLIWQADGEAGVSFSKPQQT
jgi:hypothetical protein